MSTWFNSLDPTLQVLWVMAGLSTLIFAIQFIMSIIGIGDADVDMDFDTDGDVGLDDAGAGSLFSIRSIVNFFVGFSWMGICGWKYIESPVLLGIACFAMGLLMSATFLYISRQMMKLQSSGNFDIRDCVGKTCDVYLRIPAAGNGTGKVQISLNGSIQELDARTDCTHDISSGTKVKVTEVVGQTLVVEEV